MASCRVETYSNKLKEEKKKHNFVSFHRQNKQKKPQIDIPTSNKKNLQKSHFRLNTHCDAFFLFVGTVKNTNVFFANVDIFCYFHSIGCWLVTNH